MKVDPDILLPFFTLLIGALLGFLFQLLLKKLEIRQNISEKVLDQYFRVRNELCTELSKLAILQESIELDTTQIASSRNIISELYFKYYDFLPKEVLVQLNCLFACLSDNKNRIFLCKKNRILPIKTSEVPSYLEHISIIDNFMFAALIQLQSKNNTVRRITAIKCQSRGVLKSLNQHFTMQNLSYWIKHAEKN